MFYTMVKPDMISLRKEKRCLAFSFLLLCVGLIVLFFSVPVMAAQVTLAWDSNTESDLAGYRVYYGTASRNYSMFIDVGRVNTYTVSGLTDGRTYYFAATAYNTSNVESAYSSEVSHRTCTYSISPPSASVAPQATTGAVQVTTQTGCPWTASSGASWVTITSGNQGTGNGTVSYSVAANSNASARTVASTIAGKLFTITQAGTGSPSTVTQTTSGLTNGSFEQDYTGWTATGNMDIQTSSAADGVKAVRFNSGQRTPNGVLSQSFATTAGQSYTLTFNYGVYSPVRQREQRLSVTVRGNAVLRSQVVSRSALNSRVQWTSHSYSFVADSSVTTLTFQDVSPTSDSIDSYLDNVRVTAN